MAGLTSIVADGAAAPSAPGGRSRFGALAQRDFRLLWLGMLVSQTGSWMQLVTTNWLLWELTQSPLMVGLNGLFRSLPFIAMSLYAGALADRLDRRRLLMAANAVNMVFPLGLGVVAALGLLAPWHLYLVAALSATVDSFDSPARQALIPALVPRAQLLSALGLMSSVRRATSLIGPALGGLLLASVGADGSFFLNGLSFGAVVLAAALMRTRLPAPPTTVPAIKMVREGLAYVGHHPLLGTMMGVEALVTLSTSYQAIVTVFAESILDVGPTGLGLLLSAPGVGAIAAATLMVLRGDRAANGRVLLVSGGLFGLSLVAFAASRSFGVSLLVLGVVGFLDTAYGTVRTTIVQLAAEERLRGRVMSLNSLTNRGLGPSGNFLSGALASAIGAPWALAGLALLSTVLVVGRGLAIPALRDFGD